MEEACTEQCLSESHLLQILRNANAQMFEASHRKVAGFKLAGPGTAWVPVKSNLSSSTTAEAVEANISSLSPGVTGKADMAESIRGAKKHMLTHTGENPFNCTQCNYICATSSNLKTHMQTDSGVKPFMHSCTQFENLKKHMLTHSGEKPFRCEQCNYSCAQAHHLKSHKLTHSGEKPFGCSQCSYSYCWSKSLKYHMLSHTGEKQFACKQCNYSCKRSDQLKMHMRSHTAKTNT